MEVLHMNGGMGETSYHRNSSVQKIGVSMTQPIIEEAILDIFSTNSAKIPNIKSTLRIAELGCSSGPNALLVVSYVMDTVYTVCQQSKRASPEFLVFLNDLPGNDFNTIFMSLSSYYGKLRETKGEDFGPCCVAGMPGSFYGRVFPSESLHFVHSSYSLHWLSQVPRGLENNKKTIYIAQTSPRNVAEAYLKQFVSDFSAFMRSRSKEVVHGGRMVLTLLGRRSEDPSGKECCHLWKLFEIALHDMVLQGIIEQENLDSFNLPYYSPSPMEINSVIQSEGSFVINRLETFDVNWDVDMGTPMFNKYRSSTNIANCIRAAAESLLLNHFGETMNMDQLFCRYKEVIEDCISSEETKHVCIVVSMTRSEAGSCDHHE